MTGLYIQTLLKEKKKGYVRRRSRVLRIYAEGGERARRRAPVFVEGWQAGKVHFGTAFTSAVSDLQKGDSET
jgi:hypothetical protein